MYDVCLLVYDVSVYIMYVGMVCVCVCVCVCDVKAWVHRPQYKCGCQTASLTASSCFPSPQNRCYFLNIYDELISSFALVKFPNIWLIT